MRARTSRFTSLFFGIVRSSFTAVRTAPQRPAARRNGVAMPTRRYALLCLAWTRAGAWSLRLGADRAPSRSLSTANARARGSALAHGHTAARRRNHDAGPRGDRALGQRAAELGE